MIIVLMTSPYNTNAQVRTYIVITVIKMVYLLHVKPYIHPVMLYQEFLNEITVLLSGYILLMYSDYVKDAETRYNLGWLKISLIGLNLIVNFSFMFYSFTY